MLWVDCCVFDGERFGGKDDMNIIILRIFQKQDGASLVAV